MQENLRSHPDCALYLLSTLVKFLHQRGAESPVLFRHLSAAPHGCLVHSPPLDVLSIALKTALSDEKWPVAPSEMDPPKEPAGSRGRLFQNRRLSPSAGPVFPFCRLILHSPPPRLLIRERGVEDEALASLSLLH